MANKIEEWFVWCGRKYSSGVWRGVLPLVYKDVCACACACLTQRPRANKPAVQVRSICARVGVMVVAVAVVVLGMDGLQTAQDHPPATVCVCM